LELQSARQPALDLLKSAAACGKHKPVLFVQVRQSEARGVVVRMTRSAAALEMDRCFARCLACAQSHGMAMDGRRCQTRKINQFNVDILYEIFAIRAH
jgi:hypothetical protein